VAECEYEEMFPTQWELYLRNLKSEKRGDFLKHSDSLIVFLNGSEYIGGCEKFLAWALDEFRYVDKKDSSHY